MVVGAFPIAKLGALLLKQVSKPIANALKTQAKNSPVFRKYVCLPPAQFYNWCEIKAKMWILNLGKPVNIAVLNEEMAIELGANLLGESIIFTIAAVILLLEYNRGARKEAAKELAKIQEIEIINTNMKELFIKTEEQGAQIKQLLRIVNELESGVVKKPWVPKKKMDEIEKQDSPPKSELPSGFIPIPVPSIDEKEIKDGNTSLPKVESSIPSLKGLALDSSVAGTIKPAFLKDFSVEKSKIQAASKSGNNREVSINENININEQSAGKTQSFLLQVVSDVENDLFGGNDSERNVGVLSNAINYLYKDVYRISLSI